MSEGNSCNAGCLRATRVARTASGRTVNQTLPGQKQLAKWIEMKTLKNTRRTRRTLGQLKD
jgi:hypothetical protein